MTGGGGVSVRHPPERATSTSPDLHPRGMRVRRPGRLWVAEVRSTGMPDGTSETVSGLRRVTADGHERARLEFLDFSTIWKIAGCHLTHPKSEAGWCRCLAASTLGIEETRRNRPNEAGMLFKTRDFKECPRVGHRRKYWATAFAGVTSCVGGLKSWRRLTEFGDPGFGAVIPARAGSSTRQA